MGVVMGAVSVRVGGMNGGEEGLSRRIYGLGFASFR